MNFEYFLFLIVSDFDIRILASAKRPGVAWVEFGLQAQPVSGLRCWRKMDREQTGYFMLSMAFGAMMGSATSAYVLTTLLKDFGASTFVLALIPVLGQAGLFLSLPVSVAAGKMETKHVSLFLYSLGRVFILVYVLVLAFPDLFAGKEVPIIFTAFVCMSLVSLSAGGICQAWFKQIIREDVLASLMGRRGAVCALIMGIMTPLIGFAVEKHARLGLEKNTVFLWLMVFAVVAGFIDMWLLAGVRSAGKQSGASHSPALAGIMKAAGSGDIWRAIGIGVFGQLGGLVLAPFSILLFYELGFSEGMVALVIAVSTVAYAGGQVIGGHYADKLRVREIFMRYAMAALVWPLVLLAVSIGIYSFGLGAWTACGILTFLTVFTATASGAFGSASLKYTYRVVQDNLSVTFAFIDLVKGAAFFCISLGAAKAGAFLSAHNVFIRAHFWPGCHYIQLVLVMSVAASLLGIRYLRRQNIYRLFPVNGGKDGT